MRRREFVKVLGGATAMWPLGARAQQGERLRRIGVLMAQGADDPTQLARLAMFQQRLQQLGWTAGRNLEIDTRWWDGKPDNLRKHAEDLVALAPEVILAGGGTAMPALLQATRTVPIVFVQVVDAVGAGIVDSLARPGGNATGFTSFEYGLSGKWLELVKQIAPSVTRVGVVRDPAVAAGTGLFGAIQGMAPSLGVEVTPINVRDAAEIERRVTSFGSVANGGLIVTASALVRHQRHLILQLATRHQLPAVYWDRSLAAEGGLMSYGPDISDQYRLAAGYVDRILRGEKPADLPVQGPMRYELVVNLKTAKALGLDVPPTLLARADEVVE
jgi:putative tryptophan/tyrosine transport system substrate-binding protein